MTLLAATLGLVAGAYEGGYLRFTPRYPGLEQPDVNNSIWFLAPLVVCLAFTPLGLAIGILVGWLKRPLVSKFGVAFVWGVAGACVAASTKLSQADVKWVLWSREVGVTAACFLLVFTGALLLMGTIPSSKRNKLASLLKPRLKPWALTLGLLLLVTAVGVAVMSRGTPPVPSAVGSRPAKESASPNVVLIVWDTVRADHLSAYGYSRPTSPNLDRLAAQGVLFENAISPSSWTLPAFASIFTGLLPHQHGARITVPLDDSPRTLAEILGERGYETAGFNANNYNGLTGWGIAQGFQTYLDGSSLFRHNLAATTVSRAIFQPAYETFIRFNPLDRFDGGRLNKEVYDWYRHRSRRPYFLVVNYFDAHLPYSVPEPFNHRFGHASKSVLRHTASLNSGRLGEPLSEADRQSLIDSYDNGLLYVDAQCGELLGFLSTQPEWSNTYVIVTSDHGEGFGEHGTYDHGWNLYRELVHVPLVVYGPGIPKGVRIPHVARIRELFPTILDLTGLPGAILRRTTLRRFWRGGFAPEPFDETVISEVVNYTLDPHHRGLISMLTPEWHFLHAPGGQSELYHWTTDSLDRTNLVDSPQGKFIAAQLQDRMYHHLRRSLPPWRGLPYLMSLNDTLNAALRENDQALSRDPNEWWQDPPTGITQALFRPDPSRAHPRPERSDEELVRSIPYD